MSDTSKARFDKIHASLDKIDERDKLARELAEMVIAGAGCNLSDCACGGSLTDFARRLLKLYEEEKP